MIPQGEGKIQANNQLYYQSEGVPHEVFGPWVWWGRGQIIPDVSQRRTVFVVGPKMDPNFQKNGILRFLTHSRVHGLIPPSNWSYGPPASFLFQWFPPKKLRLGLLDKNVQKNTCLEVQHVQKCRASRRRKKHFSNYFEVVRDMFRNM